MRPHLIGLILDACSKAYNSGACDNLSKEQLDKVFKELERVYSILTNMKELTLTTELASIHLNVTRLTINNYVKAGKLHPVKLLGGVLQFSLKELDNLKYKN